MSNGCNDVLMMPLNLSNIAILNINIYAINLMQSTNLTYRRGVLKNKKNYNHI